MLKKPVNKAIKKVTLQKQHNHNQPSQLKAAADDNKQGATVTSNSKYDIWIVKSSYLFM